MLKFEPENELELALVPAASDSSRGGGSGGGFAVAQRVAMRLQGTTAADLVLAAEMLA